MSESNPSNPDSSADFMKQWQENLARMLQMAGTFTPDTMPPEMLRQIRSGMFQALAKSWEEYMRSPQFLEGMKQMMDNAIAFRQMSGQFLNKARQEMQGTSRQDVDDMLLAMREMEARLTRRVDDLAARVAGKRPARAPSPRGAKRPARKQTPKATTARKSSGRRK